jgi:hypothetical protein
MGIKSPYVEGLTQLRGITNVGLTLLGSLCGIYDTEVNGFGVHDWLMQ